MTPNPSLFPTPHAFHESVHLEVIATLHLIIVMASFMNVPFMLVLHQRKCIIVIELIRFFYHKLCIFMFFDVFVCSLLLRCIHKSSPFHVGVMTLHTTMDSRN